MTAALSQLEKVLVDEKVVTEDQLKEAREVQKSTGGSLEQVLIDKDFVSEEQLLKTLAKKMMTSFVSLSSYKLDVKIVELLPISIAKRCRSIPLFKIENKITVATSNPLNLSAMDDVRRVLGTDVDAIFALDSDIERAIKEYYRGKGLTEDIKSTKIEIIGAEEDTLGDAESTIEKIEIAASGEKVVSTVNNMIAQAYEDKASDIHIEPHRDAVSVRLRIDGILEELTSLPKNMHLPVISRIKIMGGMDVAERRLPQDGRVHLRISGNEIDMRIATYPTMFGEAAAIRLLSKEQLITLKEIGFKEGDLKIFEGLIKKPHGILLVTGPTGSGKTTTLYAALMHITSKDKHILSIEDPIENEIPGVDQQQVNVKAGMTFAASLRAMLRQDPDVIMLGEIRDIETADIGMRAAMTGHLVFSTLHTNTAVGAFTRLVDLGIEPYMVTSTVTGVMAQRLVRRICERCKLEDKDGFAELKRLGLAGKIKKAYKGEGCKFCRKTGYTGRVGLFEIVVMDDKIKKMVDARMTEVDIKEKLVESDYHSLLDDGLDKIQEGITTVEDVLRVALSD